MSYHHWILHISFFLTDIFTGQWQLRSNLTRARNWWTSSVDFFGTMLFKATAKSLLLTEGSVNLLENIEHQQMLGADAATNLVDLFCWF